MPSAHSTQPDLQGGGGSTLAKPFMQHPQWLPSFPGKTRLVLLLLLPSPFSLAAPATQTLPLQQDSFSKANLYSNEQEIINFLCCCG